MGTEGEEAVDISRLRDTIGLTAYDSSLSNTAVCKSSVTFIDGEKLQHVDDPSRRLVASEPLRLVRRGSVRIVGTATRRGQR